MEIVQMIGMRMLSSFSECLPHCCQRMFAFLLISLSNEDEETWLLLFVSIDIGSRQLRRNLFNI